MFQLGILDATVSRYPVTVPTLVSTVGELTKQKIATFRQKEATQLSWRSADLTSTYTDQKLDFKDILIITDQLFAISYINYSS